MELGLTLPSSVAIDMSVLSIGNWKIRCSGNSFPRGKLKDGVLTLMLSNKFLLFHKNNTKNIREM